MPDRFKDAEQNRWNGLLILAGLVALASLVLALVIVKPHLQSPHIDQETDTSQQADAERGKGETGRASEIARTSAP
jgi:hypothetical protein